MSLLTFALPLPWLLFLAVLQWVCGGHEWMTFKRKYIYLHDQFLFFTWTTSVSCFSYDLHLGSTHILIRHFCHPWSESMFYLSTCPLWIQYEFKNEFNSEAYKELEDQRLFNPTITQPQRSQLFLFPVPPSSVQILDQRLRQSDLHSCQIIPQRTDRGPRRLLISQPSKPPDPLHYHFTCPSGIQKLHCTSYASNYLHLRQGCHSKAKNEQPRKKEWLLERHRETT